MTEEQKDKFTGQNEQYWLDRKEREITAVEKTSDQFTRDLKHVYTDMAKETQKEIEAFYGRYATETGLSLSEVRAKLGKSELKSAKEDISKYYAEVKRLGGYSPEYREYLLGLSARAYMSRLEELQLQINHEIENAYRIINQDFEEKMGEIYEDSYYRSIFDFQQTMGVSSEFAVLNSDAIERAVNKKWLGDNYSSRLWTHKDVLLEQLNTTFLRGVAIGQNPRVIAREMRKSIDLKFDKSPQGNLERLARTEFIHMANQATMDGYNEHGVKQYKWLAALDEKTCPICGELDGQIFNRDDGQAGLNVPPAHPNCRCTTTAYIPPDEIDESFEEAQRAARDPITGKMVYVPADMPYKQWRDAMTEEEGKAFLSKQKMEKYESADKEQFAQYKEAIGTKNMPKSFDKFQEMKYNNIEKWGSLQDYKYAVTHGNLSPLVSLDDYNNAKELFNETLIGLKTSDGIEVQNYSKHFIDRYFGSVEQRRSGVELEDITEALINPQAQIKNSTTAEGLKSQRYSGDNIRVTINPTTGVLIQTNPWSE